MFRYRIIFIVIVLLGSVYLSSCSRRYKMPPLITPEIDYSDSTSVLLYSSPYSSPGEKQINSDTNTESDTIHKYVYPEMIYQTVPQYPRESEKAGITGRVYVTALVDEYGIVVFAFVSKSTGHRPFDEAARNGAYNNKFKPASEDGKPVKVWVTYKVDFVLK